MCLIMTEDGWQQLSDGYVTSNHNTLEGVFHAVDLDVVRKQLSGRADRFCRALEEDGARTWSEPLLGAFGERL